MSLPTYEEATAKSDPWVIIADRAPLGILMTLSMVSKHLNETCSPRIWFDPTSRIFSKRQHYMRYDDLFHKLQRSSFNRRCLVTVMNFNSVKSLRAFPELVERPQNTISFDQAVSRWISCSQKHFPCLKFVILDDLSNKQAAVNAMGPRNSTSWPGHATFENVANNIDPQLSNSLPLIPSQSAMTEDVSKLRLYTPVLLSSARSVNILPMIFNDADSLQNLIYLDLSWTTKRAVENFVAVPHLRILKLQGLDLENDDIIRLSKVLGTQLFSLDVSSNRLTDTIVPILLSSCFQQTRQRRRGGNATTRQIGEQFSDTTANNPPLDIDRYVEEAPAYRESADPTEGPETRAACGGIESRPDQMDEVMTELCRPDRLKSIQSSNGIPPEGDSFMRQTGLTHLHISGNRLTSNAVRQLLLFSDTTQVLDVGTVVRYENPLAARHPNIYPLSQPSMSELLDRTISPHLESLRVHHSVVTETPTLVTIGDFYISPRRAIKLAEEEYGPYERQTSGSAPFRSFSLDTNPRLRNLTLTDVPTQSQGRVIDAILDTMREASIQEAAIAAAMPQDTRRGAIMLPGLRQLCLEFTDPAINLSTSSHSRAGPSVSGDKDADNFMAESNRDFSFFNGESGNWSQSANVAQSPEFHDETESEPVFSFFSDETSPHRKTLVASSTTFGSRMRKATSSHRSDDGPLYVVMAEIQKYREATRSAYEDERERLGGAGVVVALGAPHFHWTGELKMIVRERGALPRRL